MASLYDNNDEIFFQQQKNAISAEKLVARVLPCVCIYTYNVIHIQTDYNKYIDFYRLFLLFILLLLLLLLALDCLIHMTTVCFFF